MKKVCTLTIATSIVLCCHGQMAIDRYLTDPITTTTILSGNQILQPHDLDFKPNTNELWVVNYGTNSGGSVVIIHNAGQAGQTSEYRKDTHTSHFMVYPNAIAFSDIGELGCVSEILNTAGGNSTFMGPALWRTDLNIYATVFQNNWVSGYPLGSHIDMLHQSPFAMGIAWDHDKVYWVMDGHNGNLVKYDFVQDHGPGYDDHSAGVLRRYSDVTVGRVAGIPSHMVMDHATGWLYYIDGLAKKIKRVNTTTGTQAGPLSVPSTSNEMLAGYFNMTGATVETIDTWATGQPCGIDFQDGRIIVSDHTSGDIHIYDVTGTPAQLGVVTTGVTGIMGVKIGPDGRIWFIDNVGNAVKRLDPLPLAFDAALVSITAPTTITYGTNFYSPGLLVCDGSIAPQVTLANASSTDIATAEIDYSLDGGSAITYNWSGTLAPGTSVPVTLPTSSAAAGAHEIRVTIGQVNGYTDPIPGNNTLAGSFRTKAPIASLPFTEGFQGSTFPPAGWDYVHFNKNCKMDRVTTAGGFGSSTASAEMDNYSGTMNITGQLDYLLLPPVDLSSAPAGTLMTFSVAHAQYNSSTDKLRVKASTNCGTTWTTVYDKQGATLSTAPAQTAAYTPTSSQWRAESIDLAAYLGQPEVLLMFESESNWGNNVYIDDVEVGAIVGIGENGSASFDVFPDPSNGQFTVRSGKGLSGAVDLDVIALDGSIVHHERWSTTEGDQHPIDIRTVGAGAYIMRITPANGVVSRSRIVVQ